MSEEIGDVASGVLTFLDSSSKHGYRYWPFEVGFPCSPDLNMVLNFPILLCSTSEVQNLLQQMLIFFRDAAETFGSGARSK